MTTTRGPAAACPWVLLLSWCVASGEEPGTPASLRTHPAATMDLEDGFRDPPDEAKPRVYWWWLNGLVTRDAITRDLEAMREKGIGGALLFDAHGGGEIREAEGSSWTSASCATSPRCA